MSAASNYLENALLNHIFREQPFTAPSVLALALCTSEPSETDTGATISEVPNADGYARQTLNPSSSNWSDPTTGIQGEIDNSQVISFGPALASWGTITHVAILDSATYGEGNLLLQGSINDPDGQVITQGNIPRFALGELNIRLL